MLELKEIQKEEAIKRLTSIVKLKDVIDSFKNSNHKWVFEYETVALKAVAFDINQNLGDPKYDEMMSLIKKFEEKYNVLVYVAMLNHSEFGDMLSLLYVSNSPDEWAYDNMDLIYKQPYAYVIVNYDETDMGTEIGTIGIDFAMGGVYRRY